MMTPQQTMKMIAHYEKAVREKTEKPEKLVQVLNMAARSAVFWAINAQKRDTLLLNGLNEARAALGLPALLGGGTPAQAAQAAPQDTAPAAAPGGDVPRGPNGYRLNVDGSEMDADQSAREDMMDAAVNGAVAAGEIPPQGAPSGGAPGRTPYTPPAAVAPPAMPETVNGIPVSVPVEMAPSPTPAPPPAAPAREAAMERAIAAQRGNGAPAQK